MNDDIHRAGIETCIVKMLRDPEWMKAVGERLVRARTVLGKSQASLARSLGITPQRLANYEGGIRPFDIELATELAHTYGITLDYIYRGQLGGMPQYLAERIAQIEIPTGPTRN